LEASFVDAAAVAEICEQTAARMGIAPFEGPFAHPIVNDDLVGPVPERVWAIVERELMARGAALESQVVPKRPAVLIVHRDAVMRANLVAAFTELGASTIAMDNTDRAIAHLRAIGADMLVAHSAMAGAGGDNLIAVARSKRDRLRVCALIGAGAARSDLARDKADAIAIADEMLARWAGEWP
jgi:CheY-like chemotaxis protein